jgi:hypothetical protein
MMTRKPKLNLLYTNDSSMPWLQLAVVTTEPNPLPRHARQWQSVQTFRPQPPAALRTKH